MFIIVDILKKFLDTEDNLRNRMSNAVCFLFGKGNIHAKDIFLWIYEDLRINDQNHRSKFPGTEPASACMVKGEAMSYQDSPQGTRGIQYNISGKSINSFNWKCKKLLRLAKYRTLYGEIKFYVEDEHSILLWLDAGTYGKR